MGGQRRLIRGSFRLDGDRVGFSVGPYDHAKALVIDPVIACSTFLGGSTAGTIVGNSIVEGVAAVDTSSPPNGLASVTGATFATNFPVFPTANPNRAVQTTNAGASDHFVTKIDTTKSGAASLVWSTYLGGSHLEDGLGTNVPFYGGVAVDTSGNVYVTGSTVSPDFPTGSTTAFMAEINTTQAGAASPAYATYFGGSGGDEARAVAVDSAGMA